MTYRGAHSSPGTETNPVVIYVDDVPMETFQTLDINLANVERIEILRGAQGVIYGKNAFAGIIRIITKKPGNELEGKAYSQVESVGSYKVGGTVSGPIVPEKLFYSLTASHNKVKGYLDGLDDVDREGQRKDRVKGQLRFTPSESSDISLLVDYAEAEKDRPHFAISPGTVSMTSLASSGDGEESEMLNLALTGSFVFDNLTVESLTTERLEHLEYTADMGVIAGSPLLANGGRDTNRTELTQEFRIRSNDAAEGIHWLLGVYGSYADLDMSKMYQHYTGGLGTADAPFRMFTTEFAPFGQMVIPFADSWTLTTGLRWHTVHRDASINYEFAATASDIHVDAEGRWSEFLPRINLSYDITDDKMVYAGISRSFIPGGICYYSQTGVGNLEYKSQKAWNYEVGAKTEWLGHTLRINPVLFYTVYTDLQEMAYDAGTGNFLASNPGKRATAYGAEVDMTYLVSRQVEADASFGYTMAKYDDYTTVAGESYDGNRVLMSPEYTVNLGIQYRQGGGLFARGDMKYTSSFYWEGSNETKRPPVITVDGRVGWEAESWDVYLYGRNILGARYLDYYSAANNLSFVAETGVYGLEMSYRF